VRQHVLARHRDSVRAAIGSTWPGMTFRADTSSLKAAGSSPQLSSRDCAAPSRRAVRGRDQALAFGRSTAGPYSREADVASKRIEVCDIGSKRISCGDAMPARVWV